jgi:hypothetical protein
MSNAQIAPAPLTGPVLDRADAPTVSPVVANLADVLDRMRAEGTLAATRMKVESAHRSAFADLAATVHAAVKSGISVREIAAAAKSDGLGYSSTASVQALKGVGEVLTLGGDLPESVEARDLMKFFSARARIAGQDGIRVAVSPSQLAKILAREPRDVAEAYRLLGAQVRLNRDVKAKELAAVAEAARGMDDLDAEADADAADAPVADAPVVAEPGTVAPVVTVGVLVAEMRQVWERVVALGFGSDDDRAALVALHAEITDALEG